VILKSYIVEKNIEILDQYNSILLYGENNGIKDDIKNNCRTKNKESEIINIFQDELIKNKNILIENIQNESLFNSNKIVFLHEISDKVFNQLEEALDCKLDNIKIILFSGLLDKKSKLRSLFEKNDDLAIIPCYQDNERTLIYYIRDRLKGYDGLTSEITNLIINNSGLDRKIINSEIKKIKLFFKNKTIVKEEVEELLNFKNNKSFDEIRDAMLLGNKIKVNRLIGEMQFLQDENFLYINQITTRISKLLEIQYINENIKDEDLAIENLKPKVFWKDKPIYIQQLKKWNKNELESALNNVNSTELLMKKNSQINNDTLIKDLIIRLCCSAFDSNSA